MFLNYDEFLLLPRHQIRLRSQSFSVIRGGTELCLPFFVSFNNKFIIKWIK